MYGVIHPRIAPDLIALTTPIGDPQPAKVKEVMIGMAVVERWAEQTAINTRINRPVW